MISGPMLHMAAVSRAILGRVRAKFETLPVRDFLRASDAIHLAIAIENGFRQLYSNDRNLLAADPHFRVRGVNVIN